MSETNPDVHQWPPMDDQSEVYRAVLRKVNYNKERREILSGAFMRRERDHSGLSVNPKAHCTLERVKSMFNEVCAIGILVVGQIRSVDTDPSLDVIRNKQDHANIINLPAYGEDDFKAENLASELAKICTRAYPE